MKIKLIHIIGLTFFIACFFVFGSIPEKSGGSYGPLGNAVLVILVTIYSIFIVHYDHWNKLRFSEVLPYSISLFVLNMMLAVLIYCTGSSASIPVILPLFMGEGMFLYWKLDKMSRGELL